MLRTSCGSLLHCTALVSVCVLCAELTGPDFEGLGEAPSVTLEYPAAGAREEYLLLSPHDRDEYDPISDLLRAVRAMVAYYVPTDCTAQFGELASLETSSTAGAPLVTASAASFKRHRKTGSDSRSASPAQAQSTVASPLADSVEDLDATPILRALTKARNRRHGPLFVRAVERFNDAISTLKEGGILEANLCALGEREGVPESVWRTVQEQVYARVVGPDVDQLKKYEAFSDHVYGEMLPSFLSEISRFTKLGPNSVFVDLGSGIGNLLLQASLQSGAEAYGCEVMPVPSRLAHAQLLQARHRWRMWNLRGGPSMDSWCEDFTESERVRDALKRADVVLVNKCALRSWSADTQLRLPPAHERDTLTAVPRPERRRGDCVAAPFRAARLSSHRAHAVQPACNSARRKAQIHEWLRQLDGRWRRVFRSHRRPESSRALCRASRPILVEKRVVPPHKLWGTARQSARTSRTYTSQNHLLRSATPPATGSHDLYHS